MKCWTLIAEAVERDGACALVSVAAVEGSAPREPGAAMVVTARGFHGSIGGGTLEWQALAAAQAMLGRGRDSRMASYSLGPDLGQCCGGRVKIATEVFDASALAEVRALARQEAQGPFTHARRIAGQEILQRFGDDVRPLYLFGAGHVARALVLALASLPFAVTWIDARPEAFPAAVPANVSLHNGDQKILNEAPAGSLVLVMTHSHALDLAIVDAALRNPRIVHTGVIGSATKRTRFEKRLREAGVPQQRIASLICPIGIPGISGKQPAVIAASTAAQLVLLHEKLNAASQPAEARCA